MRVTAVARICAALALVLVLPGGPALAAFEVSWPDARSAALLTPGLLLQSSSGPEGSRASRDTTAPRSLRDLRATVSAGELYGVREAAGWGASASVVLGSVSVGIELSKLGGELYEERSGAIGVAFEPDQDLRVVVRARGLGIAARGVNNLWTGAVDASVTRRLLGRVRLVAASENLTRSRIGDSPVASRAGFGAALVLQSVSLRWTLLLEEGFEPSSVLSFEVAVTDRLHVRAGARDSPGRLGFGFGVGHGGPWPVVDVAVQWHPELGVSSFVSVTIEP